MVDMTLITGILVLLSFVVGIVKVTKPSVSNIVLLAVLAGLTFVAPSLLTQIAIIDSIFVIIFAIMKGFAIGGLMRLGLGMVVSKLTK